MGRKQTLEELGRMDVDAFKQSAKIPLVVILDNIRSAHNVGSVFRTADAYRVEKVYLCGFTATPPHKDIRKTALGATESVEWENVDSAQELLSRLRVEGYSIVSIEQTDDSTELGDWRPFGKTAIILGNEVAGVQQELVDQSDLCVELEQYGTKHSLNVSVCAGIVIWKAFGQISSDLAGPQNPQ